MTAFDAQRYCIILRKKYNDRIDKANRRNKMSIYGNNPEDRYHAGLLDAHLNSKELDVARIDAMADDLYRAKLAALPVAYSTDNRWGDTIGLDDVASGICYGKTADGRALACAVRDGDAAEVGRLALKLWTEHLKKEAVEEAESENWK